MIALGKHSYKGNVHELFDPVVTIGNFCSIADDVVFFGTCEHPWVMNKKAVSNFPFWDLQWGEYTHCGSRGPITIGSDVWIGKGAIIMDGVTIGDGAIIGAGAVVSSDVPPYAVAVGNPARVAKYRFTPAQIVTLLKTKWWNYSDETIKGMLQKFSDIDLFISSLSQLT